MNRFRQARIKAGLSQKEAALTLGISSPSISNWENNKSKPSHEHLLKMAEIYNTTIDYLVGAAGDNPINDSDSEEGVREYISKSTDRMNYQELSVTSAFIKGLNAHKNMNGNNSEKE